MSLLSRNKFAYIHSSASVPCIDSGHHIESRSLCIFEFKDRQFIEKCWKVNEVNKIPS